jgi:hypothetical protein
MYKSVGKRTSVKPNSTGRQTLAGYVVLRWTSAGHNSSVKLASEGQNSAD